MRSAMSAGQLHCAFAGDGPLLAACADIARSRGHEVVAAVTSNDEVRQWAGEAAVPHAPLARAGELLRARPFDCLFSIHCLSVLPDELLALPRRWAINYHDGPLPRYAGFHATSWALLNGEGEHGITWHVMTGHVDGGPILLSRRIPVPSDATAFTLNLACAAEALASFGELLDGIAADGLTPVTQDRDARLYHARHRKPSPGCAVDWSWSAARIEAFVRALDFGPVPNPLGAPKVLGDAPLALRTARVLEERSGAEPGTVVAVTEGGIRVATVDRDLLIEIEGAPCSAGMRFRNAEASFAALDGPASRNEAFWVERFGRLAEQPPAALSDVTLPPSVSVLLEELGEGDDGREAATAAFIAAAAGGMPAGFRHDALRPDASGLLADDWLLDPAPASDRAFLVEALRADLQLVAARAARYADLPRRYPRLAGRRPLASVSWSGAPCAAAVAELTLPLRPAAATLRAAGDPVPLLETWERMLRAMRPVDERAREHLRQWQRVYDDVYERGAESDPRFDISCWRSSSGEPMAAEEMREWVESTVERIVSLRPRRVLEIGCGKGLLLWRLAPQCETYTATDFSAKAVDHIRRHLPLLGDDAAKVTALELAAHELDRLPPGTFDTIILSSVVQYFPSCAYLLRVLRGALGRLAPGGRIFAGDIRNLRLLEAQRCAETGSLDELRAAVTAEAELLADPAFFTTLPERFPAIGAVEITPKRGGARNELTRWRYDVVLHAVARQSGTPITVASVGIDRVAEGLGAAGTPAVAFRRIANARTAAAAAMLRARCGGGTTPLGPAFDPDDVRRAAPAGWTCEVSWHDCGDDGEFDAVFVREELAVRPAAVAAAALPAMLPSSPLIREPFAEAARQATVLQAELAVSVPELVRGHATRTPAAIAVRCGEAALTYAELVQRGASFAAALRERGVGVGARVGILLDRSIELPAALLAVLDCGAAYVPLDPSYPRERIDYMLGDSAVAAVIDGESIASLVPRDGSGGPAVHDPGRAAYVIYTSGSTGRPKGVEVAHRSLTNLLLSMAATFRCGADDRLLAVTTICFDIAGLELFLPLVTGGCLDIAPGDVARDGVLLLRALEQRGVTMMQATPATWKMLLAAGWTGQPGPALTALCGGEALTRELASALCERSRSVWNLYGPTETTIWSTVAEVRPGEPVSLGRPIANTDCHVVDDAGARVAPGETGELLIGGDGVAIGYRNRPELTAERFVADPFGTRANGRLYRTGDRVRLAEDGTFVYLGRSDSQLKLAGYRIELGEIEAALARVDGVAEAVVVARRTAGEDDRLVAFVRLARPVTPDEIARRLREWLPEHMIPAAFHTVDRFPLTLNRKIDRQRLTETETAAAVAEGARPAAASLVDALRALAETIVPRAGSIASDRPLGEYGFGSIRFTTLALKAEALLGVGLLPSIFYRFTTLDTLAAHLIETYPDAVARVAPPGKHAAVARAGVPARRPASGRRRDDDRAVAIVGIAGRLPGGGDLDAFWGRAIDGVDSIRELPFDRPGAAELLAAAGNGRTIRGGFIDGVDAFDAEFFGISPREAELLDPRQRLLLETVWHCIEDAGHDPESLAGTRTGVFVGAASSDYWELQCRARQDVDTHTLSGFSGSLLSNRVSYLLNLHGPSATLDTACSSSLIALHRARVALLAGECDAALVAGVNLILSPGFHLSLARGGYLSPRGICAAFDRSADGYVRGEGVGALFLKPLHRAEEDGDPIHAVILASAENHGGRAQSLTAPDQAAQAELLRGAYREAGVDPRTITLVETHGTGTSLGDPIEVNALREAFGDLCREWNVVPSEAWCALGALKSSVGHLEAAAGIAGVLKVVLAMRHRRLPANLHCVERNPYVELSGSPFYLLNEARDWPPPLRAGVSSFGFGGSNAHVVLEARESDVPADAVDGAQLIVLSAKNEERLAAQAATLAAYLERHRDLPLAGVAYTLQSGRSAMDERLAFVAASVEEAIAGLRGAAGVHRGNARGERRWKQLLDGNAGRLFVERLTDERDLEKLAGIWTAGIPVDWTRLRGGPRRVRLPGYAFARDRFWLPDTSAHPFLGTRTADGPVIRFEARIPVSNPFLGDHVVRGEPVLPAVAMMELARAAAESEAGRRVARLRNLVWSQPLRAENGAAAVTLELRRSGDELAFTISTAHGPCAQGTAVVGEVEPARLDLAAIRSRVAPLMDGPAMYEGLHRYGLELGRVYRPVERVDAGGDEATGVLAAPAAAPLVLHPSLMDGALQVALAGLWRFDSRPLHLPFSVGEIEIVEPLPERCVAHATRVRRGSAEVFDITLADEDGRVAVRIRDFLLRPFRGGSERAYFAPVWKESRAADARHDGSPVVLLGGDAALAAALPSPIVVEAGDAFARLAPRRFTLRPDERSDYAALLDALRADGMAVRDVVHGWRAGVAHTLMPPLLIAQELAVRDGGRVALRMLHVAPEPDPWTAAMAGFGRTLALEHTAASLRVVITGDFGVVLPELGAGESEVHYRNGRRFVRRMRALEPPPSDEPLPLRDGGVYVITGGMGGLGRIFARRLLAAGGTVILWGRSAANEAELEVLRGDAARVEYVRGDVADRGDAARVVDGIRRRHGRIDGVVHAAGAIRDARLARKTTADALAVVRPKIDGTLLLDELLRDEPLEWFVAFSSVAALTGNAGQCDYAFANAFLDGFADWREGLRREGRRQGATISIAWPLWRDGGMHVDAQSQGWLERTLGLQPLSTESGLRAFDAAVRRGSGRLFVAAGNLARVSAALDRAAVPQAAPAAQPRASSGPDLRATLTALAASVLKLEPRRLAADRDLTGFGFDSLTFTELANRLNAELGLSVTPALFFEYSTIDALAGHLRGLAPVETPREEQPPPPVRRDVPRRSAEDEDDPIAIVGASAVLPGSETLDGFWHNLERGADLISEVPPDRWDWRACFGDPRTEPGKTDCRHGGFLDRVDAFDARFFSVSRREAELMDPQQRILLETVWRAIEDAGWRPSSLAGTRTGLFAGVCTSDYAELLARSGVAVEAHTSTGNARSILVNRVSHHLDLRGPSEPIDTACSSSLVAVDRAVAALRTGACDTALAGGVNLMLTPTFHVAFANAGMLSPTGRCRTFDHRADGYVRGEGAAVLVLERLSRAAANGDAVYGVIRGSAVGHAGHASSLTAPNTKSQAELLVDAYRRAGVDVRTIGYIEAHGTATRLGDPVEINALRSAFDELTGSGRHPRPWCGIGSVKSNFGHLEATAGVAGMLKVMLAMRARTLPATIQFERLNPYIDLGGSPFFIVDRNTPWTAADGQPLRAGVSSFGFGGVNAHVVLEEYVEEARPAAVKTEEVLVLSARNRERLQVMAGELAEHLRTSPPLADVAYTLQTGREAMSERLALIGDDVHDLAGRLAAFAAGGEARGVRTGAACEEECATVDLRGDATEIAAAWVRGARVDWAALPRANDVRRTHLPAYPFARERHWVPAPREAVAIATSAPAPAPAVTTRPWLLRPEWVQRPLAHEVAPDLTGRALIVAGSDSAELVQELALLHRDAVVVDRSNVPRDIGSVARLYLLGGDLTDTFRVVRALPAVPVELRLVTFGAHEIVAGDAIDPRGAASAGFVRVVARELPHVRVAMIDVVHGEAVARQIAAEPVADHPFDVALRAGVRHVRRLVAATLPERERAPFRERGVYLITGGAGGIGLALARHLSHSVRARVVLVGRRAHDERIAASEAAVESEGGEAVYVRADCSDRDAMAAAVAETKRRFGALHGVIHSAVVLRDRALAKMEESDLAAAVTPKGPGTAALAEAVEGEGLDFFLVFSSVQSFLGNAGQTNYAAASALQDATAHAWRQRGVPVRILNWGYWGSVGVVATPEHERRMARFGLAPIGVNDGMAAIETLVASHETHLACVDATEAVLAAMHVERGVSIEPVTARTAVDFGSVRAVLERPPEHAGGLLEFGAAQQALEAEAARLLHSLLDELRSGVVPAHERLLDALRDLAARTPEGAPQGQGFVAGGPNAAHVRLLRTAAESLVAVMRGQRRAPEVLFPRSSMELVAPIYDGNPQAAQMQAQVADAIAVYLRSADGAKRVRILEAGAGTGGTTAAALAAVEASGREVEYVYTDVSPAFLRHGQERFAGGRSWLRFATLDLERSPEAQGFARGAFDLVIATNVVHATRALPETLQHVKVLLAHGGWLLLGELTRVQLFTTMTFGLLDGWWRFTDAPLRLAGSPLLDVPRWLWLLRREGFRACVSGSGDPLVASLPEQLFVARSDGWVRIAAGQDELPAVPRERGPGARVMPVADAPSNGDLGVRGVSWLRGLLSEELRVPVEEIGADDGFAELGLDSILLQRLTYRIEEAVGTIPKTLLLEHSTAARLAAALAESHGERLAAVPAKAIGEEAPAVVVASLRAGAADDDAIAVIGAAGVFAGARNIRELWTNLREGRQFIREIPPERWDWRPLYDPSPGPGRMYCKWGAFVDDIDRFDPFFFGLTPHAAGAMPPEERLMLQVAWSTLEDAGYTREALHGERVGVFIAAKSFAYGLRRASVDAAPVDCTTYSIPNRISHFCNLTGPSFAIEAACASSLVALHLACESLRRGECTLAIVGGVNLYLHPSQYLRLSQLRVLSSEPRCVLFDSRNDGFIPGEGAAAVLLKPRARAAADGDAIRGAILATGVRHKGRDGDYLLPSPGSQASLIADTVRRANVGAETIGYYCGQAQGAALPDTGEWRAATSAFRSLTSRDAFCAFGSIKPYVGHLEAASGMSQLIAVLQQMEHGILLPTPVAQDVDAGIDFAHSPFFIPRTEAVWERPGDGIPRRACISAFGGGGMEAHAVVEEPLPRPVADAPPSREAIVVSARTPERLRERLTELRAHLAAVDAPLADVAFTLQQGRESFAERWAVVVDSMEELLAALADVSRGHRGSARKGQAVELDETAELDRLAELWTRGAAVDWSRVRGHRNPRRVPLPAYSYERRSCSLDPDGVAEGELSEPANRVASFYDELFVSGDGSPHLTFAPLVDVPQGFSWLLAYHEPERHARFHELVQASQRQAKQLLLDDVDLGRVTRALDIGCGLATDLIDLASANPRIEADGYNISPRQADAAARRVAAAGLDQRVRIYCRDSANDPFPARYDLVIGFEVFPHIEQKQRAFENIERSLAPGGRVVLADSIAETVSGVELPHLAMFTSTRAEYARTLTAARLQIRRCVDASAEVANFLVDPEFDANLAQVAAKRPETAAFEALHRSWLHFGRALRKRLFRYVLLDLEGAGAVDAEELCVRNLRALSKPQPYAPAAAADDALRFVDSLAEEQIDLLLAELRERSREAPAS